MSDYILTLSCQDDFGILAAVSGFLSSNKGFILESSQFSDTDTNRYFMRVMFRYEGELSILERDFPDIAEKYGMSWAMRSSDYRPKVLVMVSKQEHCLNAMLNSWHAGNLNLDIVAVASNHTDLGKMASWYEVPFHHLPITKETKEKQEQQILSLFESTGADFVVLARYMQILSPQLVSTLSGRVINIHHSFLPSFKGAKPYHQAHQRGVKLIGATAHYVTDDLDEGPIIDQEVQRVDHAKSPQDLVEVGKSIESLVLLRAVKLQSEGRIFINGNKTVVL